jgi:chromosome partitioning protein
MQVIVINSQKGGSAKTMLAKHLFVEAERAGDGPVFLIDTDPQGYAFGPHRGCPGAFQAR